MKQFLNAKSIVFCGNVLGIFSLAAMIVAFCDTDRMIAFLSVMAVSSVVWIPLCAIVLLKLSSAYKMIRRQEEETWESFSEADMTSFRQISSHIATDENWVVNNAIGHQIALHRHVVTSIQEGDQCIKFMTTLREKPYTFQLTLGESGEFEKRTLLHWYDPLYEIPLDDLEFTPPKTKDRRWVLLAVLIVCGGVGLFVGLNQAEVMEDYEDSLYFYDYLSETFTGSAEDIEIEYTVYKDETLMYIFNEAQTYAVLEIALHDETDECYETVYTGVIRPQHYTSAYIEAQPSNVRITSARFYHLDYHVPSCDYKVEYAWREHNGWLNVVLSSDQMTLENAVDIGIHEYAVESLIYAGVDCVYFYDEQDGTRMMDRVSNTEMWDPSTAKYRIDFEYYPDILHVYELRDGQSHFIRTIELEAELQDE